MRQYISTFNNAILGAFYTYGHFLGKHPIILMVGCVVVGGALSVGLIWSNPLTDPEELYAVMGSEAVDERRVVAKEFPDVSATNFHFYAATKEIPGIQLIVKSRGKESILKSRTLHDIELLVRQIQTINATKDGQEYAYEELCARREGECVLEGKFVFLPQFRKILDGGKLRYPYTPELPHVDLSNTIGQPVWKNDNPELGILENAGKILFRLPLRTDISREVSVEWMMNAVEYLLDIEHNTSRTFDIAFTSDESLMRELDKSTSGDIIYAVMTFVLMIGYAFCVSSGGNMVSTRAMLSIGGVLATGIGIVSSMGLVTLLGVRWVNQVGVMPYLMLGLGVDDMFLLMSAWSESTKHRIELPERIGTVFKKSGVGITITSLTNFLSFGVGSFTNLRTVRNFCIYTGTGVIMCYLANVTFFGGCLTLHGKRTYANRHTLTCRKVTSADRNLGQVHWALCGGTFPENMIDDQSPCERGPTNLLPRLLMWKPFRIGIIVVFMVNLGVAIWGCTTLKQGMDTKDLVLSTSYVHKFEHWAKEYGFRVPVSFIKIGQVDYRQPKRLERMEKLLKRAGESKWMMQGTEICWLTAFAKTPLYTTATDADFIPRLQMFLKKAPIFFGDVVIKNGTVTASRCHMVSNKITNFLEQGDTMNSVREIVASNTAADFPFSSAFVFFENFNLILPTTLQAVGYTIIAMSVVTAFFLPHPVIVLVVTTQVIMIVTCIFGYMALWDLNLSSITVVHLIMSVGLSVDFCAHVCTAYMLSEKMTAEARATHAIVHASAPILNGGTSSIVGLCGLLLSKSYIFQSFFKVMFLVVIFGVVHAVFFVPALLSFLGPKNYIVSSMSTDRTSAHASNTVEDFRMRPPVSQITSISELPIASIVRFQHLGSSHRIDSNIGSNANLKPKPKPNQ